MPKTLKNRHFLVLNFSEIAETSKTGNRRFFRAKPQNCISSYNKNSSLQSMIDDSRKFLTDRLSKYFLHFFRDEELPIECDTTQEDGSNSANKLSTVVVSSIFPMIAFVLLYLWN